MSKRNLAVQKWIIIALRILACIVVIGLFVPQINPARVSGAISKNSSLFTCAISYNTIASNFVRALTKGWVEKGTLIITYLGALFAAVDAIVMGVSSCMTLGDYKFKRLGLKINLAASCGGIIGIGLIILGYKGFSNTTNMDKIDPMFPNGIWIYLGLFTVILLISLFAVLYMPKAEKSEKYEMAAKYKLFIMMLPIMILVFVFSYLPLYGWRYAFFDYQAGFDLTMDNFVGFKWFKYLFQNQAMRTDIIQVLKNTFAMSGLGILTSWLPMAFAIFLAEIRSNRSKRLFQTLTTIPNFISWVLVYSVAFAFFSTDGFLNSVLSDLGIIDNATNYLMSGKHIWLKMWLWGTWKGLGWSAIIYISAISGIDQQLYEAATVDGAGRFKKMWYITVPCLIPTFFVMLIMSIANILSNGMDQYLVFYNAANRTTIQVLDLYVYNLGLSSGSGSNIPLATLIGMLKSLISITLLFAANKFSGLVREESIF